MHEHNFDCMSASLKFSLCWDNFQFKKLQHNAISNLIFILYTQSGDFGHMSFQAFSQDIKSGSP